MSGGPHLAQQHLVVADAFTAAATLGAALGWVAGWLTPLMTLVVLILGAVWYVIQISGSDWWKRRKQRRHRARLRRHRKHA